MRLTRTIALRSLLRRPGRTFFSILGIAVGIAIVVGIFTLDHVTILGLSHPDARDWQADLKLAPSGRVEDPMGDLRRTPGIDDVSAFFQQDVELPTAGDATKARAARALLFAVEPANVSAFGLYRVVEGEALPSRGGVLIGQALADERGLAVGMPLTLARPQRAARKICIEGEMQVVSESAKLPERRVDYSIAGILAPEKVGRRGGGHVVVVSLVDAAELYADVNTRPEYLVRKEPNADIEKLGSSLGRAWSLEVNQGVIVGQAADERAFRNGVRFAGLLALVLGLFTIFHSLSIALLERVREIGMLHALGCTRGQIARIFFVEALIVASLGGTAGLALGIGLARFLLGQGVTTLGVGKWVHVFEVPWATVLPLTGIGCGIALLGSVYPLMRAREADSVLALRGERALDSKEVTRGFRLFSALLLAVVLPVLWLAFVPTIGEVDGALRGALFFAAGVLGLLVALPLIVPSALAVAAQRIAESLRGRWPFAGTMVGRTLEERPARLATAVVVLAMVTAAYTALKGMTASLLAETELWAEEAALDRVFVTWPKAVSLKAVRDALTGVPEVLAVECGDARTYAPFLLMGLDPSELQRFGPLAESRLSERFAGERSIVLSSRLANDLGYGIGDEVQVQTARGVVESFRVLLVSDAYGFFPFPDERMYGIVSSDWMRRDFCLDLDACSRLSIRLAPGSDTTRGRDVVAAQLAARFPKEARNWNVDDGRGVLDYATRDIVRDFALFDIIIGLTALLAAIGILNGLLLAALERRKDLGVLKALGATGRQVSGMVALESLVVGLLGGAIGVVLGLVLTPVVIEALQSVSALPLPTRSAGRHAIYAFIGALATAQLAALYPSLRMRRMSATRAIRQG